MNAHVVQWGYIFLAAYNGNLIQDIESQTHKALYVTPLGLQSTANKNKTNKKC